MPTDDEKKEQDAADNDISDEITDSEKADDTELTDASDNIPEPDRHRQKPYNKIYLLCKLCYSNGINHYTRRYS